MNDLASIVEFNRERDCKALGITYVSCGELARRGREKLAMERKQARHNRDKRAMERQLKVGRSRADG